MIIKLNMWLPEVGKFNLHMDVILGLEGDPSLENGSVLVIFFGIRFNRV